MDSTPHPSHPALQVSPAQVEAAVKERGLSVVFGAAGRTTVATVLLSLLLVAGTDAARRSPWAWVWWLALSSVYLVRVATSQRFAALSPEARGVDGERWRRSAVLSATLGGLCWAPGLVLLWTLAAPEERVLIVMVISGLLPGATASLSAIPQAFVGFILPVWGAVAGCLVASAERPAELVAALSSAVLLPLLLRAGRSLQDELARATRLGLEQAALSREYERARDEARSAANARSEFLAVMSHELRTPLNGVVGLTSLLLDGAEGPDQRELARGARDSAQILLELLDGVLDLSKIDAGHLELELADFDLAEELHRLRSLFTHRAREKGLTLALEVAPGVPTRLHGDWYRLRQVLINLLGNALKFTAHGGVGCRVTLASPPGAPPRLHFEVHDTGIGLSDEQRGRLFQPFQQAERSTTRRYGGTGLGLVISQRLVALMGGALEVDSTPGQGSRFHFEVPLALALRELPVAPEVVAAVVAPGARVLVCDDNEINLIVAVRLLQREGYAVEMRRNGAEALEALATGHFDVVLMDLQMPVMDGFEALARARARGSTALDPTVPFVALTASASVNEREACLAAGFDAFLTKPIEPAELMRTLAEVREGHQGELR